MAESSDDEDRGQDCVTWGLIDVSPEGIELPIPEQPRLYRCSAMGAAAWRVMVAPAAEVPSLERLRDSLHHVLSAQWRLHCKLDKVHWQYSDPLFQMLQRLEVLWSEFVRLVAQDVDTLAEQHASEMTERTKEEMIGLLDTLRVVQTVRLGSPPDSAIEAFAQVKGLVDQWPLRMAMAQVPVLPAVQPMVKPRRYTKEEAEQWIRALFDEKGEMTRPEIERVIKAKGGPSWGTIQGTKFWRDYMDHRKERGEYVPRGGAQVTIDQAESELARKPKASTEPGTDDDDRADEADINAYRTAKIERLVRDSNAQTAEEDAPYRNARRPRARD